MSTNSDTPLLELLYRFATRGETLLSKPSIPKEGLKMWTGGLRSQIMKIYGDQQAVYSSLTEMFEKTDQSIDLRVELERRLNLLKSYISDLERIASNRFISRNEGSRVFIGHGQSLIWRELKDFIKDRLHLPWDEFNRQTVAGYMTFERISEMLDSACFAFLIMTAEDQHSDETVHARQNVVHEVGLFQGRLGQKKAIILLEEGCSEFSNIIGITQIRFPKNRISAVFEDVRRVLEREGITKT